MIGTSARPQVSRSVCHADGGSHQAADSLASYTACTPPQASRGPRLDIARWLARVAQGRRKLPFAVTTRFCLGAIGLTGGFGSALARPSRTYLRAHERAAVDRL